MTVPTRPFAPIAALAVGQTLLWAGLYYVFPALLPRFEAAFGAEPGPPVALGMTLALAGMAAAAPMAGRAVDRGRGPLIVPAGGIVASLALLLAAHAPGKTLFLAAWPVLGLACAFCLYEPAFALITRARPETARRAIASVTLVAGFATAVAFPLASALEAAFGWRGAATGLAALAAFAGVPLAAWGAARLEAEAPLPVPGAAPPRRVGFPEAIRRPGVARIAAAFACVSLCHGMIVTHMLPLLTAQGIAPALAVTAAALLGPMQVAGRIALLSAPPGWRAAALAAGALASLAAASLVLISAGHGGGVAAAALFIALQGAAIGTVTILRPSVLAETAGTQDFGAVAGAAALTWMGGMAVAPTLGGALRDLGGADAALAVSAALPCLGLALLLPLLRRR